MALGVKTQVGKEKGDLLVATGFTGIELRTSPRKTATVYDNVFNGDELGFYTGKTSKDSGITFNEVVTINSLNTDGSPNFNGTKYYFDTAMPFKATANPKYNYSGSSSGGFDWGKAAGIGGSILTALGGIFGIISGNQATTEEEQAAIENIDTTQNPEPEPTWIQKNWIYLVGGLLTVGGLTGVIYYIRKDNDKDKTKKK